MSQTNAPGPRTSLYACELCGEEIRHDVARVDDGRIYHMRCFYKHLSGGTTGLKECPACQTLGALWSWDHSRWTECEVCNGTGYLSGSPRGSGNQSDKRLAAC
ncbi:MAG TPA: hypothetical protein VL354_03325 [Spirochaetia bacterium]|nr:hypothetical protein [Spirochaetia bacterium]